MKKLLFILLILFTCCYVNSGVSQESNKEKILKLQDEIRFYVATIDRLIIIHEDGFPNKLYFVEGDSLDFSFYPTNQQKIKLRNKMKASLDSIIVKVDSMRALFP